MYSTPVSFMIQCDGRTRTILLAAVPDDHPLIPDRIDGETFKAELKAHQQGKSDFLTFIKMSASMGIEKWEVSVVNMTCTYFDNAGNEVLMEIIPG